MVIDNKVLDIPPRIAGGLVDSSGDVLKNLATPTTCIPLYSGRPTIVNLLPPLIKSVVMSGGGLDRLINDPFTLHRTTSAVLCLHLNSAVSPTDMFTDIGISINVPKINTELNICRDRFNS